LSGGGGLVSTINDYSKFVQCLRNGGKYQSKKLITQTSLQKMTSNLLPNYETLANCAYESSFSEVIGPGVGYGLGVSVITNNEQVYGGQLSGNGEYGWGGVASTWFFIDPEKDVSAIFMTQLIPSTRVPIRHHLRYLCHWAAQHY
jgi:CubicO group peptidase (beta-lactamase class C family)